MNTKQNLGIGQHHQLKIAKKVLTETCFASRFLGGPNHKEAQEIILKLENRLVKLDSDCTCKKES